MKLTPEAVTMLQNFCKVEYKTAKAHGYSVFGNDILAYDGKEFSIISE